MSEQNITTVLSDVKKFLGLNPDEVDEFFDPIVISAINVAVAELAQLGLRKVGEFSIVNGNETWSDYLGEDYMYLISLAKNYLQIKSKMIVDPPQSGSLSSAFEEQLKQTSFNIQTAIEMKEIEKANEEAEQYLTEHGSVFYP